MNDLTILGAAQEVEPLTILGTHIRQDSKGRYCLSDLHRAGGAEPHKQAAFWIRTAETRALVDELLKSADMQIYAPVAASRGRTGGTYAVKELVYAYAMWISPAFHLQVIRAFDAMATGSVQVPVKALPQTYLEALKELVQTTERLERAEAELVALDG